MITPKDFLIYFETIKIDTTFGCQIKVFSPIPGDNIIRFILWIDHKDIVLTRDQILDIAWCSDFEGYDRTVDSHIKKLRKALGKAGYHIETVIKTGYVWKSGNQ